MLGVEQWEAQCRAARFRDSRLIDCSCVTDSRSSTRVRRYAQLIQEGHADRDRFRDPSTELDRGVSWPLPVAELRTGGRFNDYST